MMEFLRIYPERLAKCREIIEDAKSTGDDQDLRESYEAIGRLFVAAMGYAFEGEQPGFSRRSFEGGEWQSWRDDVDRAVIRSQQMRQLGAKGGTASGKARQAKSTGTQPVPSDRDEAALRDNEPTLYIDEAALRESEPTLENNGANRSTNTNTKAKANSKAHSKANAYAKADSKYAETHSVADEKAEEDNKDTEYLKEEHEAELSTITETFPQAEAENSAATIGFGFSGDSSHHDIDLIIKRLCQEFPDVNTAGFRVELRNDIADEGADFVYRCLLEADKANSRAKLSVPFYKSVKKRLLEEILADGIAAGREYAARMARLPA